MARFCSFFSEKTIEIFSGRNQNIIFGILECPSDAYAKSKQVGDLCAEKTKEYWKISPNTKKFLDF